MKRIIIVGGMEVNTDIFSRLVETERREKLVPTLNWEAEQQINSVVQTLLPFANLQDVPDIFVYDNFHRTPNAYALPDKYISVADNAPETYKNGSLAMMLAHELAHIKLQHGIKKLVRRAKTASIPSLVTVFDFLSVARLIKEQNKDPYDITEELEADRMGAVIALKAGYSKDDVLAVTDLLFGDSSATTRKSELTHYLSTLSI